MSRPITTPGKNWIAAAKDPAKTQTDGDEAVSGFYRPTTNGILFFDLAGAPFAFLVANRHRERFFVSCHQTAEGVRYMFCTSRDAEEKLGIDNLSLLEQRDLANEVADGLACDKANAVLNKLGFSLTEFVNMANMEPTCAAARKAFHKAGLTVDALGVEPDGYLLASRLGRVMLRNAGYQSIDGRWSTTQALAA